MFQRQLRNHMQTLLTALARYDPDGALSLVEPADSEGRPWSVERLRRELDGFLDARHQIRLDPEARNARHTHVSEDLKSVHQTLIDPDDFNDWSIRLTIDAAKSDERRTPVLLLESIGPI